MVFGYLRGAGAPPDGPASPDCLFCGDTATVAPRAHSFLSCQKRMGRKEALGDASYCALTRVIFWLLRGLNALTGTELLFSRLLSVPKNVLHADAGRLHLFRFCSFPEYSADYDITQHVVGADVGIGPYKDSQ